MKAIRYAVLVAALSVAAHAEPLTFAAALDRAAASAPSIRARALQTGAARSLARAAGKLPDPQLMVDFQDFPVTGPVAGDPGREDFSEVRVGVTRDIPALAKRRAARERAQAEVGTAQAGGAVEARTVRVAAALAWIDVYVAERKLATLAEVERGISLIATTAAARVATGAIRPGQATEPARLRADLADRRAELGAEAARARAQLARWTGESATTIAGAPPLMSVDPVRLRAGLDAIPVLAAYQARSAAADADVGLALADRHSDLGWRFSYARRDPRFGDLVAAGVTIGLPFFTRTRQNAAIEAKGEEVARVLAEREAARRELAATLEGELADHAMHHQRLETARASLLPLAERRASLERASYAAGRASLGDTLDATLALAEARLDLIDREAAVTRDAVRLNLTYGDAR